MSKPHCQNWLIYVLGLWMLGSPWLLEHSMMLPRSVDGGIRAMWNLWLVGLAVVVLGIVSVGAVKAWEEWTNFALGAWLLASPWILGFRASSILTWNAVTFGAAVDRHRNHSFPVPLRMNNLHSFDT